MADCLCTRYAKATEWAALAGARWLGRADEEAAEDAAASAMKAALDDLPIDGQVVFGSRSGEALTPGGSVGAGGERVDLALDPIEGRGVVARGGTGAMSMLAVGPPGSLLRLPDMYMRRMAAEMDAVTSPSWISLIRAPAPRISSIRSWWRGRSRTSAVMSFALRPNARATAATLSATGLVRSI